MYAQTEFEDGFERNLEVARSAFADMLHDDERNKKYSLAIKDAIDIMHSKGQKANVLEIGTGTGLLAMMAAKHGADSVVTIEAFGPISEIAKKIIETNQLSDKIIIIQKMSTQVVMGIDIKDKANILVTELFDTELIGEGAIESYNHAHKNLMVENCLAVPTAASIYVQIVESPSVIEWNKPKLIADLDGDVILSTPKKILDCYGAPSIHDVQLSQLPVRYKSFVNPTEICVIDFSKPEIPKSFQKSFEFKSEAGGCPQAVFFWWDLKMNPSGSIILSCAPYWAHPDTKQLMENNSRSQPQNVIPWRDHWMQGIYYLKGNYFLNTGETINFIAHRDEFSWWFELVDCVLIERPICECLFHVTNSRTRIAELNDNTRVKKFMKLFESLEFQKDQEILVLGDCNIVGISLAKFRPKKKIHVLEENSLACKVIQQFLSFNHIQETIEIHQTLTEFPLSNVSMIFAEPHFMEADVPWDNITEFLKRLKIIRKSNSFENCKIIPERAEIWAVPVHFLNLYKIRHPLREVESFDHRIFDEFIEEAANLVDKNVEPFSLWEYPSIVLGSKKSIFQIDFGESTTDLEFQQELLIESSTKPCNGVILWMNWQLSDNISLNGGLVNEDLQLDQFPQWKLGSRQGVHLIYNREFQPIQKVKIQSKLNYELCQLFLDFSYE